MPIHIMTIDDYDEIYALWAASLASMRPALDSREAVERFLRRNPGLSVIAREGDRLVGSILCGHDGRCGYLYHVAVDAAHRRAGVGQAMVNACLAALRAEGITNCALVTFKTNALGNAFWPSQGFQLHDNVGFYWRDENDTPDDN